MNFYFQLLSRLFGVKREIHTFHIKHQMNDSVEEENVRWTFR